MIQKFKNNMREIINKKKSSKINFLTCFLSDEIKKKFVYKYVKLKFIPVRCALIFGVHKYLIIIIIIIFKEVKPIAQ